MTYMTFTMIYMHILIGWYIGSVLNYTKENDTVEIEFDTEEGVTYKYSVAEDVKGNRIKLAQTTKRKIKDYEEICEIGAVVEMKWSKDELSDTNWPAGETLNQNIYWKTVCICMQAVINIT